MISVIICTYNRCESLKDTLDSLLTQENDGSFDYEVLVVDNNSKDKTKEVVEAYMAGFSGKLRYIFEPNQGISYARNRGIKEAKGEIIAFTDDDCILDKTWLKNIAYGFSYYNADCIFGKIIPQWDEKTVPKWLFEDKRLWACLAMLDYGDKVKTVVSVKEQLFGGNFAVKTTIFRNEIKEGFDLKLGAIGEKIYRGEDAEMFSKLLFFKKKVIYVPGLFVRHKIESQRLSREYFRRWHFYSGCSYAARFVNVPLWFIMDLITINLKFIYYLLSVNSRESFRFYLKAIFYFGVISGFLKKNNLCRKLVW